MQKGTSMVYPYTTHNDFCREKAGLRTFEFFELPPEIRNMIYEHWFSDRYGHVQLYKDLSNGKLSSPFPRIDMVPLRASRKFYQEAICIFYDVKVFSVKLGFTDMLKLPLFRGKVNITSVFPAGFRFERLSHLWVLFGRMGSLDILDYALDWASLTHLPHLKSLHVTVLYHPISSRRPNDALREAFRVLASEVLDNVDRRVELSLTSALISHVVDLGPGAYDLSNAPNLAKIAEELKLEKATQE